MASKDYPKRPPRGWKSPDPAEVAKSFQGALITIRSKTFNVDCRIIDARFVVRVPTDIHEYDGLLPPNFQLKSFTFTLESMGAPRRRRKVSRA